MEVILPAKDVPPDLLEYFEPMEMGQTKSVFVLNPGSYPKAHFATFPPALVRPMILAGTSERGACGHCGAPWERVTTKELIPQYESRHGGYNAKGDASGMVDLSQSWTPGANKVTTTGWRPTCSCLEQDPIPCTVLDPFLGSGTVADVARQLGRRWVGIELSKEYCDDHIIPRLTEPLIEWAQTQPEQPDNEPEPVQLGLDL